MGNLAKALGDSKNDFYVLVPYDPQMETENRGPFKIITYKYIFPEYLHILGYSRTFKSGKALSLTTYLLSPFMYFFALLALLKLVKREKIELINAHWLIPNGFIAALVKSITGIPLVTSIPGADVHMGGENEIFRQMVGFAIKRSNYLISDSLHYVKQLNELGFYPKNLKIIRYGVNTQIFKPILKNKALIGKLGLSLKDKIVLAVGRMVSQKGYIYLVQAFELVSQKNPYAKLVIVGDGYEKTRLEDEAKRLNVEKKVIFPGTISYDQLVKFYNIADVFAMPSIRDEEGNIDASPVAMMEAMACGVPVVATKFSGNEDLVISGETGFLVKEKSSKEIAQALIKLLSGHDRMKSRQKVRTIALNNFSIETVAREYIEIFNKVVS